MAPKKRHENKFFPPLSFIAVFGSGGIQDPGSEILDPEWVKIRIWDPGLTSRIRNTAKNLSVSSQKYGFGIRDREKTYPGSGFWGHKGTGSRIRICNTCLDPKHCSGSETLILPYSLEFSVADPDPGSGAFMTPWIWDPE